MGEEKDKMERWKRTCELANQRRIDQEGFKEEARKVGTTNIVALLLIAGGQETGKQDVNLLLQCARALDFFKEEDLVKIAMMHMTGQKKLPKVVLDEMLKILKELSKTDQAIKEMLEADKMLFGVIR